ncbi:Protein MICRORCHIDIA 1, partial [Mucuna pruriens]
MTYSLTTQQPAEKSLSLRNVIGKRNNLTFTITRSVYVLNLFYYADINSHYNTIICFKPLFNTCEPPPNNFDDIGSHGTKVVIYNLWWNDEGIYELNFDDDAEPTCGTQLEYPNSVKRSTFYVQHVGPNTAPIVHRIGQEMGARGSRLEKGEGDHKQESSVECREKPCFVVANLTSGWHLKQVAAEDTHDRPDGPETWGRDLAEEIFGDDDQQWQFLSRDKENCFCAQ